MRKRYYWLGLAASLLIFNATAWANGFNFSGLGSRASAMGGAFVGLADDFSALYWNPAGIANFGRRTFGFYGADVIPVSTYKLDWFGQVVADAKSPAQHYFSGMASYFQPIGERFTVGFGVYNPAGLGAKWNGDDFKLITQGTSYEWKNRIGMITFSPVLAFKLSDRVQIGVTLNINRAFYDFKTYAGAVSLSPPAATLGTAASPAEVILGQYSESLTGWGFGGTLGVLIRPFETLSVGLTLKTPSAIRFRGTAHVSNFEAMDLPADSDASINLTWPLWLACGIAYAPSDKLILTADVQVTNWKRIQTIDTTYEVHAWKTMLAATGEDTRPMRWKNTAQVRFGAEYKIDRLFLRGGYAWNPSPAPDETMDVLIPSQSFDSFSIGLGYSLNGLRIDAALEYSKGRNRVIPIVLPRACYTNNWRACFAHSTENLINRPGYYSMKIWAPSISISYGF